MSVEAVVRAMQAALPTVDPAHWAAFTMMATRLVELRSKLMLPIKAACSQVGVLRPRFISYAETLAAMDWLDRRPQLGWDV